MPKISIHVLEIVHWVVVVVVGSGLRVRKDVVRVAEGGGLATGSTRCVKSLVHRHSFERFPS